MTHINPLLATWSERRQTGADLPWRTQQDPAPLDVSLDDLLQLGQACAQDLDQALALVANWRARGLGLEDLYLQALAPCARLLGHWWTHDVMDFAEVTLVSSNLQRILQHLSDEFCAPGHASSQGRHVLLATEPSAQHTLGAQMLGQFFQRSGWQVTSVVPEAVDDLVHLLQRNWFDAVGLSISTQRHLDAVKAWIPILRQASPNAGLRLLAGGPATIADTAPFRSWGLDWCGGDARETVRLLDKLTAGSQS